ncbi:hypothetical protein SAMN05421823_102759 [Catalinimonas alkaloidigena]|uniref:Uncharacterized protein n=1 Tax=Catalinimonas alkaloidigena TaxID=1075417 RepID=A0A1G9BZX1_9BACT|nr:hypothetical protein SAMN05421823_102759 [Catalinimonas alkaloidigena]
MFFASETQGESFLKGVVGRWKIDLLTIFVSLRPEKIQELTPLYRTKCQIVIRLQPRKSLWSIRPSTRKEFLCT